TPGYDLIPGEFARFKPGTDARPTSPTTSPKEKLIYIEDKGVTEDTPTSPQDVGEDEPKLVYPSDPFYLGSSGEYLPQPVEVQTSPKDPFGYGSVRTFSTVEVATERLQDERKPRERSPEARLIEAITEHGSVE